MRPSHIGLQPLLLLTCLQCFISELQIYNLTLHYLVDGRRDLAFVVMCREDAGVIRQRKQLLVHTCIESLSTAALEVSPACHMGERAAYRLRM